MHRWIAYILLLIVSGLAALLAQDRTVPEKLVLKAKNGAVVFDHSAHAKREKNNCKVCHPALFAEDAKKPVAFKPPHAKVEGQKASCGFCHHAGGAAFETKANCTNGKCHVKPAPKKG
jgi:c(7)-type cytochrome triheme protein